MPGDRSELPTAMRLAELRQQGIIPYSSFSTWCVMAVVVVIVFGYGVPRLLETTESFLQQDPVLLGSLAVDSAPSVTSSGGAAEDSSLEGSSSASLSVQLGEFLKILVAPVILATLFALLWGVVQTQGLFRWSAIKPAWSTNRRKREHRYRFIESCVLAIILTTLVVGGAVVLTIPIAQWLSVRLMPIGVNRNALETILIDGRLIAIITVASLIIAAVIAALLARFRFKLVHKMTREEVRREG